MGRLDKRTSNEEDDRSAREATERRRVSRAEQLREAQAAAASTAAQKTLVDEVYELVNEFLELMEEKDYPGLETVTLPMTRWWWPFPRPTRKAVWTIVVASGTKTYEVWYSYCNTDTTTETVTWRSNVYLIPEGELWYDSWSGRTKDKAITREWQGEDAASVKKKLKELIRQYSR